MRELCGSKHVCSLAFFFLLWEEETQPYLKQKLVKIFCLPEPSLVWCLFRKLSNILGIIYGSLHFLTEGYLRQEFSKNVMLSGRYHINFKGKLNLLHNYTNIPYWSMLKQHRLAIRMCCLKLAFCVLPLPLVYWHPFGHLPQVWNEARNPSLQHCKLV